jgi:hypothetical protein
MDPAFWHHVSVTFRADVNVLSLWLDAQHVADEPVPTHSAIGNTLPVEIGRNGPSTDKYWLGKLYDIRIWNVARNGSDISATYRHYFAGPQAGLVAHWRLDDGTGPTAADSAGGGHTAALNGGAAFFQGIYARLDEYLVVDLPPGGAAVSRCYNSLANVIGGVFHHGTTAACTAEFHAGSSPLTIAQGQSLEVTDIFGLQTRYFTTAPGFTCSAGSALTGTVVCSATELRVLAPRQRIPVVWTLISVGGPHMGPPGAIDYIQELCISNGFVGCDKKGGSVDF